jgi:phage gpG-like protein
MSRTFVSNLPRVKSRMGDMIDRNVQAAARAWQGGVVKTLKGKRSGRFYRVPGTGRQYQASRPGEPPASATGRLRTSIDVKRDRDTYIVGTPVIYGLFLERGTRNMEPRKFIRPGFEKARAAILAALRRRFW